MRDLVDKLTTGKHALEISLRPERNATAFKEACDRGYVHVKFTATRGGTDLGLKLIATLTDLSTADFNKPSGEARLAGDLVLDYVRVRCHAEVEMTTLTGWGWLERLTPDGDPTEAT